MEDDLMRLAQRLHAEVSGVVNSLYVMELILTTRVFENFLR